MPSRPGADVLGTHVLEYSTTLDYAIVLVYIEFMSVSLQVAQPSLEKTGNS